MVKTQNSTKAAAPQLAGIPISGARAVIIKVLLASVAAAGIIGIISLVIGEFGELQGRILLTVILTAGLSIASLINLSTTGSRFEWIGLSGIIVAFISFCLGLWLVWVSYQWYSSADQIILKNYAFTAIVATAIAHICLIVRLLLHKVVGVKIGAAVTIGSVIALTLLLARLIYLEDTGDNTILARLMGVFGILIVLGTIITPVWGWLQKK